MRVATGRGRRTAAFKDLVSCKAAIDWPFASRFCATQHDCASPNAPRLCAISCMVRYARLRDSSARPSLEGASQYSCIYPWLSPTYLSYIARSVGLVNTVLSLFDLFFIWSPFFIVSSRVLIWFGSTFTSFSRASQSSSLLHLPTLAPLLRLVVLLRLPLVSLSIHLWHGAMRRALHPAPSSLNPKVLDLRILTRISSLSSHIIRL